MYMKNLVLILLTLVYFKLGFSQVIIYPESGCYAEKLAAKEVRRYIYLRTDQILPIETKTSIPSSGDIILVANDDNAMVDSLRNQINQTTTPGGIIIKSVSDNGRTILVITGNNSESTLIAAYRFAEHLGVGFDFAGDAIPDAKIPLSLTGFDEAGARRFDIAGLLPFHDFFQGPDLWSTDEYMVAMNQLAKMGMNFFGLHNYPTYSLEEEREDDVRQGPEPNVWIGLPEDINPDGTINWAYPSYYRHSHSPYEIWGTVEWNTGNYFAGSADIFPRDFWGSDIFGTTAMPTDVASSVEVYNKQGEMFNKAFGFAKDIGVKTAIGTELPLGIEPEGPEVDQDWVRGMPVELQDRLSDPGSSDNVKAVYKAIFDRIMKTHDLDYFWLWSYEIWSAYGINNSQIQAVRDDITLAMEAANEMNVPFTLGHAGWILGTEDNPEEFDDLMPKDNPFYCLWDEAQNMEELSADRVKWAATWLEEDWGLIQPQLEVHRVYDDALAAFEKDCNGLIGKGWRTRGISMNTHSLKKAIWAYGPTGTTVDISFPSDKNAWIDEVYTDWATRWFGSEVAAGINDIMGTMDKGGEPAVPIICDWDTHDEGINSVGSAIIGDVYDESDTDFVSDIEALQSSVVGVGNQERFKYWLKTWQSYRAKDEFGGYKEDEDRAAMASKFEEFMTLDIERLVDVCDVGEIMHNNVLNWHQLVQLNELEDQEEETGETGETEDTWEEGDIDTSELPENVQDYIAQLGDDFDEVWIEEINGELFIIVTDSQGDEVVFNLDGEIQGVTEETEEVTEETWEEGDVDPSELPENVQDYIAQLGDDFDEVWIEEINGELFIIVTDSQGDEVAFNLEGEQQNVTEETEEETSQTDESEDNEETSESGENGGSNPSQIYTGEAFIKVFPVRTQLGKNEALKLNIIGMGVETPTLKYRELGDSDWINIAASNVGRNVYSATIPAQQEDFEYYLEAGSEVFPVTANSVSPIYQTVVVIESSECTENCSELILTADIECFPQQETFTVTLAFGGAEGSTYLLVNNIDGSSESFTSEGTVTYAGFPFNSSLSFTLIADGDSSCSKSVSSAIISCVTTSIEMIDFSGKAEKNGNLLSWETGSEEDCLGFILQRSSDGFQFEDIADLSCSGNSSTRQQYDYLDVGFESNKSFYRLLEKDSRGIEIVSDVVIVLREDFETSIQLYPDPAHHEITVKMNGKIDFPVNIKIYDSTGKIVRILSDLEGTDGIIQLNVADLNQGVYYLNLQFSDQNYTSQFIKK